MPFAQISELARRQDDLSCDARNTRVWLREFRVSGEGFRVYDSFIVYGVRLRVQGSGFRFKLV